MEETINYPFKKPISFKGSSFSVVVNNNDEFTFWKRYEACDWEEETLDFLVKNSGDGWFLDVGSWIGPMSLLLANYFQKIISVDFDPVASEHFRKNIELNNFSNIQQVNIGLSDKRSRVKLNKDFFGSSETSLFYTNTSEEGYEVEVITFLDLIERIGSTEKIRIVKIDIEGGEFKIINDVYRLLDKHKLMVMVSYHPFHIGLFRWRIFRFIHCMKQLKYTKYLFTKSGVIKIKPYDFTSLIKHKFPLGDVLQS